jgi:transposase InsO family protein
LYIKENTLKIIREQELILKLLDIKKRHPAYGYRRIRTHLKREGIVVNRKKLLRILKENKLLCPKRKPRKAVEKLIKTVFFDLKYGINLVDSICVNKPYQVLRTDFTELVTIGGTYHLIVYLCQFTKLVAGWHVSRNADTTAAITCLKPILPLLNGNCYIHQDQGTPFTSYAYLGLLSKHNLHISFSEAGTPTDNSYMESFFSRLKDEWGEQYNHCRSLSELRSVIEKAVHYHNFERIHSALDNTPYGFLTGATSLQKSV